MILKAEDDFESTEIKTLFAEKNGNRVPYFIKEIKKSNAGWIISLEGVENIDAAKKLVGHTVSVESNFIVKTPGNFNWIGFELIDKKLGPLGKIDDVTDNGAQLLLTIQYKGKEIILPLADDLIEKIDEKNKKLFYNAPEGLIELYL